MPRGSDKHHAAQLTDPRLDVINYLADGANMTREELIHGLIDFVRANKDEQLGHGINGTVRDVLYAGNYRNTKDLSKHLHKGRIKVDDLALFAVYLDVAIYIFKQMPNDPSVIDLRIPLNVNGNPKQKSIAVMVHNKEIVPIMSVPKSAAGKKLNLPSHMDAETKAYTEKRSWESYTKNTEGDGPECVRSWALWYTCLPDPNGVSSEPICKFYYGPTTTCGPARKEYTPPDTYTKAADSKPHPISPARNTAVTGVKKPQARVARAAPAESSVDSFFSGRERARAR
jgi:hypothetical protein